MSDNGLDASLRLTLEDFLLDYAHAIDDDELERWPEFFADDGVYLVIPREGYEAGHRLGVMLCRGRGMMIDRVRAMRQANIYEPQRYTHILSRSSFAQEEYSYRSRTNFQIVRTMQDGSSGLFVSGHYLDHITVSDGTPILAERVVLLDSRRIDTLLVVPL